MPLVIDPPARFLAILDELERFQLPARIRRDPPPPKKPVNPRVKPRHGELIASISVSASSTGRIPFIGGDHVRALIEQAGAEGITSPTRIAEWLNAQGYSGRGGAPFSKTSVSRIDGRTLEDYEARLAEHTASIRQALKEAKAEGCRNRRHRADFLNAKGLRTFGGHEWDRKAVLRWWKTHPT